METEKKMTTREKAKFALDVITMDPLALAFAKRTFDEEEWNCLGFKEDRSASESSLKDAAKNLLLDLILPE